MENMTLFGTLPAFLSLNTDLTLLRKWPIDRSSLSSMAQGGLGKAPPA